MGEPASAPRLPEAPTKVHQVSWRCGRAQQSFWPISCQLINSAIIFKLLKPGLERTSELAACCAGCSHAQSSGRSRSALHHGARLQPADGRRSCSRLVNRAAVPASCSTQLTAGCSRPTAAGSSACWLRRRRRQPCRPRYRLHSAACSKLSELCWRKPGWRRSTCSCGCGC